MGKYIDADLLRNEIEKNKNIIDGLFTEGDCSFYDGENDAYNKVFSIIDSLQQEQPEEINDDEKIMNFFDALGDCGFSQHDILLLKNIWKETGCPFPKSQVADASKMQQKVDLEKEYTEFVVSDPVYSKLVNGIVGKSIARHFYELARQKYEK